MPRRKAVQRSSRAAGRALTLGAAASVRRGSPELLCLAEGSGFHPVSELVDATERALGRTGEEVRQRLVPLDGHIDMPHSSV